MASTRKLSPTGAESIRPTPSKPDGALKTPSWTAIVDAYHRDGNGDREMLLALLHAKAKEDERLGALDALRAEQLRAYNNYVALCVQADPVALHHYNQQLSNYHAHQPFPSTSSDRRARGGQYQHASPSSHTPPLSDSGVQGATECVSTSRISSSTETVSASYAADVPTLVHGRTSRQSSADTTESSAARTPHDSDNDKAFILPPCIARSPRQGTSDSNKKRRLVDQHDTLHEAGAIPAEDPHKSKRCSPTLPSIHSFDRKSPGSTISPLRTSPDIPGSARSLRHLLHDDFQTFSSTRHVVSDMRRSSEED